MSFINAGRSLQQNLILRANYTQRFPIIDAVLKSSRENQMISVELDQMQRTGKKRKIVASFYPPVCDPTTSCSTTVCDESELQEPKQATYEITHCLASRPWKLNKEDVRLVDGNYTFSDHANMQILATLNGLRKELAQQIAGWFVMNMGVHPDGNPTKLISFTDPTSAAVRPLGLWEIEREFRDLGLVDPYIVGGADVFTWQKSVQFGGLNGNGIQTGQLPTSNMYYDIVADNAFGDPTAGHVIAYDPQMVKFVSFSRNAGIFATTPLNQIQDIDRLYYTSGTYMRGTFADPVTGLLFDLDVKFEDCPEDHFVFQLRIEWDLFLMPEYQCLPQGVNGIFGYNTCLPVAPDCPETPPTPPATPTVFEWDTSEIDCFPLYVGEITLGGITVNPNVTVASAAELAALLNSEFTGYVFEENAGVISYTGFSGVSGSINGTIDVEFTPATT